MKSKEITSTIIKTENQILVLSEKRKKVGEELVDIREVMRKIREQQLKLNDGVYCFSKGVGFKKKSKQIYPFLEKQVKQLTGERLQLDKQMLTEMKVLVHLMKDNKLVGGQLDIRVNNLLKEYELNYEEQLML